MAKNKSTDALAPSTIALPEGFSSVVMDVPFYNTKGEIPLRGYLVDCVDMPKAKSADGTMKDWQALVFITTAETEGITRDGEIVPVAIGERIAVGSSAALAQLEGVAREPGHVREVFLKMTGKTNLGGGKTFTNYAIAMTDTLHSRNVQALASGAKAIAQLEATN